MLESSRGRSISAIVADANDSLAGLPSRCFHAQFGVSVRKRVMEMQKFRKTNKKKPKKQLCNLAYRLEKRVMEMLKFKTKKKQQKQNPKKRNYAI